MALALFTDGAGGDIAADPPRDRVTAGDPRATIRELYESPEGKFLAGTWTCTPGRWRIAYDETEYCHILAGRGALIAADGSETAIGPGDEFVVPPGFTGEWLVTETMTKRYVILLP